VINLIRRYLFRKKEEIKNAMAEGAMIIDVRTPEEFTSGHVKGAKNIPLNEITSKCGWLKKSGKKIIVVCRSGQRSGLAKRLLKTQGIEAINGGSWTHLRKFENYSEDSI
jgi:phage shock protein E